jgi:general secretion pathway protein C
MDVAKRAARLTEQSPEQWLAAANQYYLPSAVSAVLVVAIAYKLASLTWALVPGEPLEGPPPALAVTTGEARAPRASADLTGLVEAHLFGKPPEEPPPQQVAVIEAPDTTLNLRLTGVVAGEGETGYAIIGSGRGLQKAYRIGETIEGASGARLYSVYPDRVILDRSGAHETLRLPEHSNGAGLGMARTSPPPRQAPAPVQAETPSAASLREVISDNVSTLSNVIRAQPHTDGGQIIGFRINPGRERDAFAALGLEPGDVVTDINGTPLTDPAASMQIFESLGEATMANVTLMRDGVVHTLVIDTSQLDNLAEGRQ